MAGEGRRGDPVPPSPNTLSQENSVPTCLNQPTPRLMCVARQQCAEQSKGNLATDTSTSLIPGVLSSSSYPIVSRRGRTAGVCYTLGRGGVWINNVHQQAKNHPDPGTTQKRRPSPEMPVFCNRHEEAIYTTYMGIYHIHNVHTLVYAICIPFNIVHTLCTKV